MSEAVQRRLVALGCFFLSGVAGLIAEVCWIRRASLAFGSTTYALSTVLAVFFLGLTTGAFLAGERSPRVSSPLRLYAWLEIVLALLILISLPLFDVTELIYGWVYRKADVPGFGLQAARVALAAAVILPPTVLMGATLPLLCRHLMTTRAGVGSTVGLLYGVNTLGAAAGAALCGFLLLPRLGMQRSLLIAAALDLLAGVTAAALGTRRPTAPPPSPERPSKNRRAATAASVPLVACLFFITGFVAAGNEVLWTRFLSLVVRTTVLTYTISLTVVLLGIVLGSWTISTVIDRVQSPARLFGAILAANSLTALGLTLLPPNVWRSVDSFAHLLLLLPPAVLSGAAFPVGVRMVVTDPALVGVGVGRMAAVNTLGGIVGSLLAGFVLLPRLGLSTGLLCTTGLALAGAFVAWWRLDHGGKRTVPALATAVCALAWIALPRAFGTRLPQDYLAEPEQLVSYREGRESNLAVVRGQGTLRLEADRWWQGQDRPTHQILAAHVPLLLHPAPRRVLVVGVGAGQTPAQVLLHDIERLDCIDIEPGVFDLVRTHFGGAWLEDPRTRLVLEDGRSYLEHTAAHYDVIALELGQLFRPGVASFYSVDFYAKARDRLSPNGILSQFVPLPFLSPETLRSIIATFVAVFPQSILWYNTSELLLLGVNGDRFEIPAKRLELLTSNPHLHDALRYRHWGGPAYSLNQPHVFLAGFLIGPAGLATLGAEGWIESDDRPWLAYASRGASATEASELRLLDLLRPHLTPLAQQVEGELAPELLHAAVEVRGKNLADFEATALLRQVDPLVAGGRRESLGALLERAQRANPENVQVYRLKGDLALFEGRSRDAQAFYERVLQLDPEDGASHLGLARLLLLQREVAGAVEHYRVALAQGLGDAETHNAFGGALASSGDISGARTQFELAVELRPEYAEAHNNLAAVLHRGGDLEGARRHLETALRLRPDYREARANLAKLQAQAERK